MNVVITGVGGQGTVLASRLVAYMGMEAGLPVRTAETIGMAQRGGCVTSHVRIGADPDDLIASPLVPQGTADLVLAFEPGEGTRALSYLSGTGGMVVSSRPIIPVTASLASGGYDPEAHLAYLADRLGDRLVVVDPAVLAWERPCAQRDDARRRREERGSHLHEGPARKRSTAARQTAFR